jgi:hypothetical protein
MAAGSTSFAVAAKAPSFSRLSPWRERSNGHGLGLAHGRRSAAAPPPPLKTSLRESPTNESITGEDDGDGANATNAAAAAAELLTAAVDAADAAAPGAKTRGWGKRRGAIPPDSALLNNPATHGYCVYSHADWAHAYKSVQGEFDYSITSAEVEGVIPAALRGGVLYRAGPGLFERGGAGLHKFESPVGPIA